MIGSSRYRTGRSRLGFTLTELVVATGITTLLSVGLASSLVVAVKAFPTGNEAKSLMIHSAETLDEFVTDLASAKTILTNSATMIEFTVADRGGVPGDETIKYDWSGIAGAALTRQVNGGTVITVQQDVQSFNVGYLKKAVTTTTNQTVVSTGPEQLLSTWTSYPSGSPTTRDFSIAASGSSGSMVGWSGEYFDLGSLPANLTKIQFTKVKLWMKTYSGSTTDPTVSIHRAQGGGNPKPQSHSLGSAATISRSLLLSSYAPVTVNLPGNVLINNANKEFVIVVKGPTTTPSAYLKYLNLSSGAPSDVNKMQWSNNAGSSWLPRKSLQNNQDVPFEVWGTYETTTTAAVSTTTYYLKSAVLALTVGTAPSARLDTTVSTPNLPVVAGP